VIYIRKKMNSKLFLSFIRNKFNVKDKNQCAKFKVEFENSCLKLEEYIKKLESQAKNRKQLVQLMEQSEIFYDAQFKDAEMVHNVSRQIFVINKLQKSPT